MNNYKKIMREMDALGVSPDPSFRLMLKAISYVLDEMEAEYKCEIKTLKDEIQSLEESLRGVSHTMHERTMDRVPYGGNLPRLHPNNIPSNRHLK